MEIIFSSSKRIMQNVFDVINHIEERILQQSSQLNFKFVTDRLELFRFVYLVCWVSLESRVSDDQSDESDRLFRETTTAFVQELQRSGDLDPSGAASFVIKTQELRGPYLSDYVNLVEFDGNPWGDLIIESIFNIEGQGIFKMAIVCDVYDILAPHRNEFTPLREMPD